MIFGYPWFKRFNPDIDWEKSELKGPKAQIKTYFMVPFSKQKHGSNRRHRKTKTSSLRHSKLSALYGWELPLQK